MNEEECEAHGVGLILTQMYSLRKGTEVFGEQAERATMTELSQINDFKTYRHFTRMSSANRTEEMRLSP